MASPNNTDTDTNNNEPGASSTSSSTPDPTQWVSRAEHDRLQAITNGLRDENEKTRKGKAEAKQAEQKTMLENQEFKALSESQAVELESLRAWKAENEPKIAAGAADAAAREAALEASIADLPDNMKAMVNSGATLAAKEQLAGHFLTAPAGTQVKTDTPTTPDTQRTDLVADPNDPAALLELRRADPAKYREIMDGAAGGGAGPTSSLDAIFGSQG